MNTLTTGQAKVGALLTKVFRPSVATIAAAGSNQGNAAALTSVNNNVTGADGTKGVILPQDHPGQMVTVMNGNASSILKVYPGSGDAINAAGTNVAYSLAPLTSVDFFVTSANNWVAAAANSTPPLLSTAAGIKVASGILTPGGTGSDTVVTGLATCTNALASVDNEAATGALDLARVDAKIGNQSGAPAAGSIIILSWKFTSSANPTLIASSQTTQKVSWLAIGT